MRCGTTPSPKDPSCLSLTLYMLAASLLPTKPMRKEGQGMATVTTDRSWSLQSHLNLLILKGQ